MSLKATGIAACRKTLPSISIFTYLRFLFRNIIWSTISGSKLLRLLDTKSPAVLKILSEGTEVACTANRVIANLARNGYLWEFSSYHAKGEQSIGQEVCALYRLSSDIASCSCSQLEELAGWVYMSPSNDPSSDDWDWLPRIRSVS